MDRTSQYNKVDVVRLYASQRLNLLLLAGAEVRAGGLLDIMPLICIFVDKSYLIRKKISKK